MRATLGAIVAALAVCALLAPATAVAAPADPKARPAAEKTLREKVQKQAADEDKGAGSESQPLNLPETDKDDEKPAEPASTGTIGRMFFGLIFVVGVIYFIYWLLKRYNRTRVPGLGSTGADSAIEVLATTQLSPTRTLHLIRLGDEVILIGATDGGIAPIRTVDVSRLVSASGGGSGTTPNPAFQSALTQAMTGTQQQQTGFLGRVITNLQTMTAR